MKQKKKKKKDKKHKEKQHKDDAKLTVRCSVVVRYTIADASCHQPEHTAALKQAAADADAAVKAQEAIVKPLAQALKKAEEKQKQATAKYRAAKNDGGPAAISKKFNEHKSAQAATTAVRELHHKQHVLLKRLRRARYVANRARDGCTPAVVPKTSITLEVGDPRVEAQVEELCVDIATLQQQFRLVMAAGDPGLVTDGTFVAADVQTMLATLDRYSHATTAAAAATAPPLPRSFEIKSRRTADATGQIAAAQRREWLLGTAAAAAAADTTAAPSAMCALCALCM